jgi:import receptor subunit TOM20
MRRYFLEQVQRGEDCLSRGKNLHFSYLIRISTNIGDLDNGVDHLVKAIAVCSQPQSLMSLFQQTLPPELFQEIIMRLPRVAQVYKLFL